MKKKAGSCVRRAFVALILLCAGTAGMLQAETPRASLSVGPLFSYGYADIYEYVYYKRNGDWWKMSELDWDMRNTRSFGGTAQFKSDILHFDVRYEQLFFNTPGFMQDYDWLNDDDPEHLTNYSIHDNEIVKHHDFEIEIGIPIKVSKNKIVLTIGLQRMLTMMDGVDGWKTYESENWEKKAFTGNVISYRQEMQVLWTGVTADILIKPGFDWTTSIAFNPFVFSECFDDHWAKSWFYYDTPDSGVGIKVRTGFSVNLFRHSQIALSGKLVTLPVIVGNDYISTVPGTFGTAPVDGYLGGTGYLGWDVTLSYRIRIF